MQHLSKTCKLTVSAFACLCGVEPRLRTGLASQARRRLMQHDHNDQAHHACATLC